MNTSFTRNQRRFPRRAAFIIARYTVKEGHSPEIVHASDR